MQKIFSYECTYCAGCADDVLHNVCPTCGGGFAPRPIRPQHAHRDTLALGLVNNPARVDRVHSQWSRAEVDCLTDKLRNIDPARR